MKSDLRNSSIVKAEESLSKPNAALSSNSKLPVARNYGRHSSIDKKLEIVEPEFNPSRARRVSQNQPEQLENNIKPNASTTVDAIKNQAGFNSEKEVMKLAPVIELKQNTQLAADTNIVVVNENTLKVDEQGHQTEIAPYIKNNQLKHKYCLVLDLDETLVHYKVDPKNPDEGEMLVRPFMYDFLSSLEKHYELILFTAGTEEVY